MGKNVIEKKSQNISVQDELYREIILGFEDTKEMTQKKSVQLSTIQKQRVPSVSKFLLKSNETKYFTQIWIKNLSSSIDIDAIKNRLIQAIKNEQQSDEENDIEEADEEKKSPFDIFQVLRLYRAIRTVQRISQLIKNIKRTNSNQKSLSKELSDLDSHGEMGQQLKKILLMGKLQDFLMGFLNPMIGKLCSSIFTYYDTKLIPKIASVIENYKEEGEKIIAKFALGAIPVVGGFAAGVWDLWDAGCSLFEGEFGDAAFLAGSGVLSIIGGVLSISGVGYLAQLGIVAAKWGLSAAKLMYKISEAMTFSVEEQQKLRNDISNMTEDKILPIVENMNAKIDGLESKIRSLEVKAYDTVSDYFDMSGKIKKGIKQVDDQLTFIGRVADGVTNVVETKTTKSINDIESSEIKFLYSKDSVDLSSVVTSQNEVGKRMRLRHSVKYNFYVDDEDLDELTNKDRGLYGLRDLPELIKCIEVFFTKIYHSMFSYYGYIIGKYSEVLDSISKGEQKLTINNKTFSFPEITSSDFLIEQITKKVEEMKKQNRPTSFNMNSKKQSNKLTVKDTGKHTVNNVWSLSNKTLRPFVPYFNDGVFRGMKIELQDSKGEVHSYDIDIDNMTNNSGRVAVKSGIQRKFHEYIDYLANFHTNGRCNDYEETFYGFYEYLEIFNLIEEKKQNNKFLPAIENDVENQINQIVTQFYQNLLNNSIS